jgi:hypothetical protein
VAAFVKEAVLPYLSAEWKIVRKAAAKAACLFYAARKSEKGSAVRPSSEVLDRLLNVAISDPEQEIR